MVSSDEIVAWGGLSRTDAKNMEQFEALEQEILDRDFTQYQVTENGSIRINRDFYITDTLYVFDSIYHGYETGTLASSINRRGDSVGIFALPIYASPFIPGTKCYSDVYIDGDLYVCNNALYGFDTYSLIPNEVPEEFHNEPLRWTTEGTWQNTVKGYSTPNFVCDGSVFVRGNVYIGTDQGFIPFTGAKRFADIVIGSENVADGSIKPSKLDLSDPNTRIGIGNYEPTAMLDVSGVVKAQQFLEGSTPLSDKFRLSAVKIVEEDIDEEATVGTGKLLKNVNPNVRGLLQVQSVAVEETLEGDGSGLTNLSGLNFSSNAVTGIGSVVVLSQFPSISNATLTNTTFQGGVNMANADLTVNNLNVIGTQTIINTDTQITDQLVIENAGTGPALVCRQSGVQPVAEFIDAESGTALFIGNEGNVGLSTNQPMYKLDVVGTVRANEFIGNLNVSGLTGQIGTAQIQDLAVTDPKISSVSTSKLTGTIGTAQIANSAVTDAKISGMATSKLTGTIATSQIADSAVTDVKISSVATSKLTGTIGTSQIADSAVTDAKISSVATSKLSGTIGTAQIANLAVTDAKISGMATSKLTGTISTAQIADSAVTDAKVSTVSGSKVTGVLNNISNVGIGTTSSTLALNVIGSTYLEDSSNDAFRIYQYNNTDGAPVRGFRSRGTKQLPTGLMKDDAITGIRAFGHDGTAWNTYGRGSMNINAAENWSTTSTPTNITFITTPINSVQPTERVRIDQNGNVGIGTNAPQSTLDVIGTARATTFSGSGASLTNLPAASITGVLADGNIPSLAASKINSGRFPMDRMPTEISNTPISYGSFGYNVITNGNGDAATYQTQNLRIKSHWGLGFQSFDDVVRTVLDTRSGNLFTLGNVNIAGTFQGSGAGLTNIPYQGRAGGFNNAVVEGFQGSYFGMNGYWNGSGWAKYVGTQGGLVIRGESDRVQFLVQPTANANVNEYMNITLSGNVGMGFNSPSQKLDVNGNIRAGGHVFADAGTNFTMLWSDGFIASRTNQYLRFGWTDTAATANGYQEHMRIHTNGYIGIKSTAPNNVLQVGNGGRLRIANNDTDYTLIGTADSDGNTNTRIVLSGNTRGGGFAGSAEYITTSSGAHVFRTGATTERMRINTDGVSVTGQVTASTGYVSNGISDFSGDLRFRNNAIINIGFDKTKEANAGKIGYQTFSSGLDIVGAGTVAGSRLVTIFDNLSVGNTLNVPNISATTLTNATLAGTTNASYIKSTNVIEAPYFFHKPAFPVGQVRAMRLEGATFLQNDGAAQVGSLSGGTNNTTFQNGGTTISSQSDFGVVATCDGIVYQTPGIGFSWSDSTPYLAQTMMHFKWSLNLLEYTDGFLFIRVTNNSGNSGSLYMNNSLILRWTSGTTRYVCVPAVPRAMFQCLLHNGNTNNTMGVSVRCYCYGYGSVPAP